MKNKFRKMSIKEVSQKMEGGLLFLSQKYGIILLESSIGLIYIWFGLLKFFPGISPAEMLAADTLDVLTFHFIDKQYLLLGLASWEVLLGALLFLRLKSKFIIWSLLLHMVGTLSPMFIFPEIVFSHPPYGFTIVGQYIMKNLVIISAALVIYSKKVSEHSI